MAYICMCFGWFHELLEETRAADLAAAEKKLLEMLDHGGMIVHVYREADAENPELVGRHRRLRLFNSGAMANRAEGGDAIPHEVERFLLDPADLHRWKRARETGEALEKHWSVVEMWALRESDQPCLYGKARLIA